MSNFNIRRITFILLWIIFTGTNPLQKYPKEVEKVLNLAGKNRSELINAILYFQNSGDSLKLRAVYFLIANMDIHYSANYYWADNQNRRINFNEFAYPNFETSIKAFEKLNHRMKLHPVSIEYKDIDSIKATFLINNVEQAFEVWKKPWAKNLPFNEFCEYILPYRVSIEPLQFWRPLYRNFFSQVTDSINTGNNLACFTVENAIKGFFLNSFNIETRSEPLPRLGPLQLLFRKQGACEDVAGLCAYAMRSQGIPCGIDNVTWWATSSGRHFWNVSLDDSLNIIPFDASNSAKGRITMSREPAKVIRTTFAKQFNVIAFETSSKEIPPGFMQTKNFIDVTSLYWPVKNIECTLFASSPAHKFVYACVLNSGEWCPTWWGKVNNGKTIFSNMARGVVYLPMYYTMKKLRPAGYPIALWYDTIHEIRPDTIHKHTIILKEQKNYLVYRPGKKYKLYYWNNSWIFLQRQIAGMDTHELVFKNIPTGALLRLIPEYTENKERPFLISADGQRMWW